MDSSRFTSQRLAFLIGVPLAWAALLALHAVVAVVAAALAFRRAGTPLAVSVLLGLSAIVAVHAPPVGPIGLVFFALAVVLVARSQVAARA